MFRVFAFLTKKDGLSVTEFIDYYENTHIPLICRSAPVPCIYKRRYVIHDVTLAGLSGRADFDVMTELGFPDRSGYESWIAKLSAPEVGSLVAADESRFLNRSRTRAFVVEEHVTSGA